MATDIHNLGWQGSSLHVTPIADGHKLTGINPRGIVLPDTEQLIVNASDTFTFVLAHDNGSSSVGHRFRFTDSQDHVIAPGEILWCVYVELPWFVGWLVEPVEDALAASQENGSTSAPTYSSAPFAVIPEMMSTVVARGGNVLLSFTGSFAVQSGDDFDFALYRDGSEIAGTRRRIQYTASQGALDPAGVIGGLVGATSALIVAESAGEHTYDVRWSRAAGAARAVATNRNLVVVETPVS